MTSGALKKILYAIFAFAVIISFTWKPIKIVSQTNESDKNPNHVRKVYNQNSVGQTVKTPYTNISGLSLKFYDEEKTQPDAKIILNIKDTPDSKNLLFSKQYVIKEISEEDALNFDLPIINLPNKDLYFSLSAPELDANSALLLQYQIDGTKLGEGQIYQNNKPSYGDLAFSTLSSPPLYLLVYLQIKTFPPLALALFLIITAIPALILGKKSVSENLSTIRPTLKKEKKAIIFIYITVFLIFLPTVSLYFRQDDFVLLERARVLLHDNPILLLTNRGFMEPTQSDFKSQIAFYRPVTNSIVPTFLYLTAGMSAWAHYVFNNLTHALNAVLIYLLFRNFLKKRIALIFSLTWATSASILITVAWLSSIQEILATTFILITLLFSGVYWKHTNSKYIIGALTFFSFALLSKENSFVLLALIPLYCFALTNKPFNLLSFQKILRLMVPFIFIASVILVLHTAMLNDPGMQKAEKDSSYKTTANLTVVSGNLKSSLAFIFRGPLSLLQNTNLTGNYFDEVVTTKGWSISLPLTLKFSIGVLCLTILYTLIKRPRQSTFSIGLYLLMSIPFLILLNERQERWLHFPLIGLLLTTGIFFELFFSKLNIGKSDKNLFTGTAIIILVTLFFGYYNFHPEAVLARKQSQLTRNSLSTISRLHPTVQNGSSIYFVGFPKDRQQNMGYAAITLLYRDSSIKVFYVDEIPRTVNNNSYFFAFDSSKNNIKEVNLTAR